MWPTFVIRLVYTLFTSLPFLSSLFDMTIANLTQDELAVATLRLLSVDMIAKAKSGHPGE